MKKFKITFILMCFILLTACSSKADSNLSTQGEYNIYYLKNDITGLAPVKYIAQTDNADILIDDLMKQFITVPQDVDVNLALDDKVVYNGYSRDQNVLYLYFDSNYSSMKTTRRVLCNAALTEMLTQITGIDHIGIYSGEQSLMDDNGLPVGLMSANDFIDTISDINSFEKTNLTLYFADESGDKLKKENRTVVYNINTSMEKLIVEQIMEGPQSDEYKATIPSDVKLLSVSVNENICYINFDEGFLTPMIDQKDYIAIYSLVDSLSELSTVSKVQILINGSQDINYRDSISLNTLFERNLDNLIQ